MENKSKSIKILSIRLCELLESEAYTPSTIKDMKFILKELSAYMSNLCIEGYTPEIGRAFVEYCSNSLHLCSSRISRAVSITNKLDRLSRGFDGAAALLSNKTEQLDLPDGLMYPFMDYLAHCKETGNKQTTIDYQYWICGKFLKNLSELGCKDICNMTVENVQAAFLTLGYMRYWQKLRPFLRFLLNAGFIEHDYSELIQHCRFPMPQPAVYTTEEIRKVENSFDLSSPGGIRNYAIILLMTRYGIRTRDISALTFDNVDLANNRLHFIQKKTNEPWEAELLPEVKEALENYINNSRPKVKESKVIFMTAVAPYRPINNGIINTMVVQQFKNADIDITEKRHGSRAFRSSVASNMLNDGVSTEIVRKVLGHGTEYALKHYARIDVNSMCICPLAVPKPKGNFKIRLLGKEDSSNV